MSYEKSTFQGDEIYCINTTGDVVVGDEVCFEQATFSGSWRCPKFDGFEKVEGKVIKESYGKDKGQHTFTIGITFLDDAPTEYDVRIKGRNLYKNGVWRKSWADESLRKPALEEKHERGAKARAAKEARLLGLVDTF